mmetsp:Transcript_13552/g.13288  ORF Transcript_13552/g.13288 Transcript_13552/m.13288 type:complete len:120 (+) Transcript_13552:12-371(+)
MEGGSLYDRLGGKAAIDAVVDGMYAGIFTDAELTDFFKKTDKERQKEMQRKFLTTATGGPQEYDGKNMKDAHKGRGITEKEFNLVAGHVVKAMKDLNVSEALIGEVTTLLMTLKDDCTC